MRVDARNAVLDVVGDFRVEDFPPERDHLGRFARCDGDMAEAPLAGHKSADQRLGGRCDLGLDEQLEGLTLGSEKAPELCDAAQRCFLARDFLNRDLARVEARQNHL